MKNSSVTVIDYGMGNLWSVISALKFLNYKPIISADPDVISLSDRLILPGVGSFRKAMISLKQRGLDLAIVDSVKNRGHSILGICLGMQLLSLSSDEDGESEGLGLIPADGHKFDSQEIGVNKLTHIGFDLVKSDKDSKLFKGLNNSADFYFIHSYRLLPKNLDGIVATCNYGVDFLAAYEKENIFATQFHPEKSQTNGLILLQNYLKQK